MKKIESTESIKSKTNLTVGFTLYFVENYHLKIHSYSQVR